MPLKDLGQLSDSIKSYYEGIDLIDRNLPDAFIKEYSNLIKTENPNGYASIKFGRYSAVITTTTGKKAFLPNSWFYIAAIASDYINELDSYIKHVKEALNDVDVIRLCRQSGVPEDARLKIKNYCTDPSDAILVERFLSDYEWWGGGKSIDRGDVYVSPIMKLAGLLAETQTAIAEIASHLAKNPSIRISLDAALAKLPTDNNKERSSFNKLVRDFSKDAEFAGTRLETLTPERFLVSFLAKPFLILTGLSGSGKTQLAMAFAKWISASKEQHALIAVGADWTSNENMLGYPDALNPGHYRKPDNGALDLILRAKDDRNNPYFLILDEMNLSHVERYFADFLSAMESGEPISLHDGGEDDLWGDVPGKLKIPDNVFVIGTVNVDETTYMFSPKVLDRANVIEFRVCEDEMQGFLENPVKPDLELLAGKGKEYAQAFLEASRNRDVKLDETKRIEVSKELMRFFPVLQEAGAEFGYRTANEICRFMYFYGQLVDGEDDAGVDDASSPAEASANMGVARTGMDAAIMLKLLPKLHGSKKKLGPVLEKLVTLCAAEHYPMSAAKIARMQQRLADHGFTSFAEA